MHHTAPHHPANRRHDVVVVGARIAGAATAIHLARAGHRVALVDRARFPSDTLSTHAIARTGVILLDQLGLLDAILESGAPAIRDVAFHHGGQVVRRTIKDRHGVDFVVAPRRHVLDHLLVATAEEAGVDVLTGTTVTGVVRDADGRVVAVRARGAHGPITLAGRCVIGADGLRSRIARSVHAPIIERHDAGGALHYAYFRGDWPAMEYYVGERCSAGIFPTHHGDACIWVSQPNAAALAIRHGADPLDALHAMIGRVSTELLERTLEARPTSMVHGQIALPNHRRQSIGPGWALVGDAAYHRDPITGHGISDALRDADLVARAVASVLDGASDEASAFESYAAEQHRLMREIFDLTLRFVEFPPAREFVALQMELSRAIERQAECLARTPIASARR